MIDRGYKCHFVDASASMTVRSLQELSLIIFVESKVMSKLLYPRPDEI